MPDLKRGPALAHASFVKTRLESDVTIITVSGELDLATANQLDQTIREAEESSSSWIVIDLDGLSFLDSTGLSLMLEAHKRSMNNGNRLRFVRSRHEQVTRLLSLTGTSEIFA